MKPSDDFLSYVDELMKHELSKAFPLPDDIMARKMWDSAQFDHYLQSKHLEPILDALGLPTASGAEYEKIISYAIKQYKEKCAQNPELK